MMYPFLTLDDSTEIVHSEMKEDGRVKVCVERPDERDGFHHAACWLPDYTWEDVFGFSDADMERFQEIVQSTAHLILEFSQEGGFEGGIDSAASPRGMVRSARLAFSSLP